jgi:hypothetical protein
VHLLFVDDPHGPTSAGEWEVALKQADDELGLTGLDVPAAGHVLLAAGWVSLSGVMRASRADCDGGLRLRR